MRLFVAADLPAALRERLSEAQRALRDLPLEVRWVRPEGIHLTFFFLGEVEKARLGSIGEALRGALREGPGPFRLHARGIGRFPERGRPRVIWAGLEGDLEAAARLKTSIDAGLEAIGFRPDERPFHPHLTLGRVQNAGQGDWSGALARQAGLDLGGFEVRELVLFESHLDPGGARYRREAVLPLAAGGPA